MNELNEQELNELIKWLEDALIKAKVCYNPNDNHKDYYWGKQRAYTNVLNILQTGFSPIDDDE